MVPVRKTNIQNRRSPVTVEELARDSTSYLNELVLQMHQLISRIDTQGETITAQAERIQRLEALTAAMDASIKVIATDYKTSFKNAKFGTSDESTVDICTLFVSSADDKLKYKSQAGVITSLT